MRSYGYIRGTLSSEDVMQLNFSHPPEEYEIPNLPAIHDQGSTPKCVSVCLTDMINYRLKFLHKKLISQDDYFYRNRLDKSMQGTTPKLAFELAKSDQFYEKFGYRVKLYSRLTNFIQIKSAILAYGPVMSCFIAKSEMNQFWCGTRNLGGHAVLLVGFDNYGFTIRNSWGTSFGDRGYYKISYAEIGMSFENWVLIN